ncbi:MAG: NlpC/P60 family protein [Caldicoprobacterales bacterium]
MKSIKFFWCMVLSLLMLVGFIVPVEAYTGHRSLVYTMYVNDQEVGVVRFAARALAIYDRVEQKLREQHEEDIFIDSNVYFREAKIGANGITNDTVLASAIEEAIDIKVNAYAIVIDGDKICYVPSSQEAHKVVEDIKKPYIEAIEKKDNSQLEEISLKQDVSFEMELVSEKNVISSEKAVELILHGSEGIEEYEVKEGDSLWSIANANNVKVEDLQLANPEIEDELIRPGDIVKICQQRKLLTVVTEEKIEYSEEVPFETEVREDNTLEKGKTKVIQQGEKGEKEIIALVTKEDGQEIKREIIEEKVIKEPVKHIEAKGTKVVTRTSRSSNSSSSRNSNSGKSSSAPVPANRGSRKGKDVANYALKFVGYPYKRNGKGPSGFDCSGFTSYVYKQFGVSISSSSVAQRSVGKYVPKSQLQPGDIVCFKNTNHVGIYIGGGEFVHASTYKTGVKISSLKDGKYPQRYVTARRIFD